MALNIHILDIIARDQKVLAEDETTKQVEFLENDSSDEETFRKKRWAGNKLTDTMQMILHIFGSTAEGKSVRIDVEGFKPFFYIRVPNTKKAVDQAVDVIKQYLLINLGQSIANQIEVTTEMKEVLFEYTASEKFPFLKLTMPSITCFRSVRNLFLNSETQLPRLAETENSKKRRSEAIRRKTQYTPEYQTLDKPFDGPPQVYEANLDPMLRFLHLQNITPCGWVTFETLEESDLETDCSEGTLIGSCDWTQVVPMETVATSAPFLIASWDIECFSRSGDFPLASKKYENVIKPILEKAKSAANFGEQLVEYLFRSDDRLTSKRLTQKTVSDFVLSDAFMTTVSKFLDRRGVMKAEEKEGSILAIGTELNSALGRYAMPAGDPLIQIGTVFRRLGKSEENSSHIFVLGDCDSIEGAHVYSFKTERKLISAWCEFITKHNPDILTGYNIFGFDERYLWERAKELGLVMGEGFQTEAVKEIMNLSRLSEFGGAVRLDEKFLSSSALGDNIMHIISIQGRLQIDLYNYVKRNFNLPSYKLDEVTKNFMSGSHKTLTVDNGTVRLNVGKKAANEVGLGRSVVMLDELGESLTEKMVVIGLEGDELVLDAACLQADDAIAFSPDDAVKWVVVKDDVSPQELFKLHGGSATDRAKIAKYCIQDCDLVLDLFKKLDVFNNAMSMANVCTVPVNFIFSRGQGIKCESLIFKFCYRKNQAILVLPAPKNSGGSKWAKKEEYLLKEVEEQVADDSYEGAIVLEPKPDFYQSPVGVCDFASLYPSTIISENISHDSVVWIRDYDYNGNLLAHIFGSDKYDRLEGISYTDIEFDLLRPDPADMRKNPEKIKVGTRVCRYAQKILGTIPEILQGLLAKRKATRKQAEKEDDPFRKALLDAEQNAYKITANSLYGQLGSGTFKVRLQSLAASVTAYGRKQILFAKAAIEKFYGPGANDPRCSADGAQIVYGDSVASYTPVIIRRNDIIEIIAIEELGEVWTPCENSEKEFCALQDVESWTEQGWTPIETIIRHTLAPTKKMIRVVTKSGIVDVTDDHSLIKSTGEEISPKEVKVGDKLLHHEYPQGKLKKFMNMLIPSEDNDPLTIEYTNYIDWQKYMAHTAFILSSYGYNISFSIDNSSKTIGPIYRITYTKKTSNRSSNAIKTLCEIPYSGYVYDLTTSNHHFQAGVGKMIVHNTDSLFVNFNVRNPLTGEPLNGREAIDATISLTKEAGKFVSGALKAPHDFEFDKVYWPFLIFSKKRYIGNKYEDDSSHFSQAFMGVALKRRDYAQIVKTIYGGAIKILLNQREGPVPTAVEFVRKCAMDLVEGKYGLGQLLISKSLRADYANPLGVAHKVLADRITARDPGNAPAVGDRITFVYVATAAGQEAPKLQGDRIETPGFIKAHRLAPDYKFYIEHQIANPICQMFGLLLDKFPEMEGVDVCLDAAEREIKAYELLFGPAIATCDNGKKREFVRLMFKVKEGEPTIESKTQIVRKPRAAVAKAVQSTLDTFWIDTARVKQSTKEKAKTEKKAKQEEEDKKKGALQK